MKYAHASSSITRDYGSFDGSCGTPFCPCAQTLLPRRLSHSVSHTLLFFLESQNIFVTILEGVGSFKIATCFLEIFTCDVGTELSNP